MVWRRGRRDRSGSLPPGIALVALGLVAAGAACTEWQLVRAADAGGDADSDSDVDADSDAEADSDPDTDAEPDAASDSDLDPDVDLDADADLPDADLDVDADRDAVPCSQELVLRDSWDDGEVDGDALAPDGEPGGSGRALMIGSWDGSSTWSYFRFTLDRAIPPTATVTAASLRLFGTTSVGPWDPDVHALIVFGEDSADAPAVASQADNPDLTSGRPICDTSVRWPETGGLVWEPGWNASTDLARILQRLVALHGGLEAGAHVQLWLRGAFRDVGAEVGCDTWTGPPENLATLAIEWGPC